MYWFRFMMTIAFPLSAGFITIPGSDIKVLRAISSPLVRFGGSLGWFLPQFWRVLLSLSIISPTAIGKSFNW